MSTVAITPLCKFVTEMSMLNGIIEELQEIWLSRERARKEIQQNYWIWNNLEEIYSTFEDVVERIEGKYHRWGKMVRRECQISEWKITSPNARKSNAWFVTFFWKYPQVMHFKQFLKEIFWKFSRISQIFRTIYVFRPNARKVNTLFVKYFRETCQNNRFFCNFLKKFFENFLKIF